MPLAQEGAIPNHVTWLPVAAASVQSVQMTVAPPAPGETLFVYHGYGSEVRAGVLSPTVSLPVCNGDVGLHGWLICDTPQQQGARAREG